MNAEILLLWEGTSTTLVRLLHLRILVTAVQITGVLEDVRPEIRMRSRGGSTLHN